MTEKVKKASIQNNENIKILNKNLYEKDEKISQLLNEIKLLKNYHKEESLSI